MTTAGAHLVVIHDYFRTKLAQLCDELHAVADGRAEPAAVRAHVHVITPPAGQRSLGVFCAQYCALLTEHHGHEDAGMFPKLREFEPALGPAIDRLEREHDEIHAILVEVDEALVDFVQSADGAAELTGVVDRLSDALLAHLAYEEEQLVGPLDRYGYG